MNFAMGNTRAAGKRGSLKQKAGRSVMVEGESVHTADIAARLGVSQSTALLRLKREQAKPGAVTWGGLSVAGA